MNNVKNTISIKYFILLEYIKSNFINNALNLSISIRAGKETNLDFFSSSE